MLDGLEVVVSVDAVRAQPGSGGAAIVMDLVHQLLSFPVPSRVIVHGSGDLFRDWPLCTIRPSIEVHEVNPSNGFSLARWRLSGWGRQALSAGATVGVALAPGGRLPRAVPLLTYVQQPNAIAPSRRDSRNVLLHLGLRVSIAAAEAVAVQTETMARRVSRSFGVSVDDVHVTEPALSWVADPAIQHQRPAFDSLLAIPESTDRLVLALTSDAKHKRVDAVREVAQAAADIGSDLTFAITVDPRPGWPSNVRFLGRLRQADAFGLLSVAEALLFLSDDETYGLPLREAAMFGIPAVVADRPYARALQHLQNLHIVPDDASKIVAQLSEPTTPSRTLPGEASLASLVHSISR